MPAFEEARRLILDPLTLLVPEPVILHESLGRVMAEALIASWSLPSYDNSAMDGFAVCTEDCSEGAILRLCGVSHAGSPAPPLEPGGAIKIMTGAPIPAGCDAVIPWEDIEESSGEIKIKTPVCKYQHIRRAGEDVQKGEEILARGTVIRPAEINMLASSGKVSVTVYRRPKVAIVVTGDELIEAGEPLEPGKVINSNELSLAAAVKECGAIPVLLGIARDTHASHIEKMTEGLKADVLITSAGVSTGTRDLVREILMTLGMKLIFHGVDMKPGGPTCFGLQDGRPIFCLPGNPVASLVTFEELVRPALLKMMGHRKVLKPLLPAILQEKVQKRPGKTLFLRVQLVTVGGKRLAYSAGNQKTGMLKTMVRSDGLAMLPADGTVFSPGDEIQVHLLSGENEMLEA